MSLNTCILLSTFDKYYPVAKITSTLIEHFWPSHPPLFVAGLDSAPWAVKCFPPLAQNSGWCSVLARACSQLLEEGFDCTYLILDDHPPLNSCHERHLNLTLPNAMKTLDATYIGLNGWGYGRSDRQINGSIEPEGFWKLEKVSKDFRWKASLHPGLWSLPRLTEVFAMLQKNSEQATPWGFERLIGSNQLSVTFDQFDTFYRVCGRCMTASKGRFYGYWSLYGVFSLMDRAAKLGGFSQGSENRWTKAVGYYYEGPYPLFWSGLLTQGRANLTFKEYLKLFRRDELNSLLQTGGMASFGF